MTAFCYWHYWFGGGTRLLTRPVDDLLADPALPHRYCLGRANQSWTGVWHGRGEEVLQQQSYPGESDDVNHFRHVLPHLSDERYLTIEGRPVF